VRTTFARLSLRVARLMCQPLRLSATAGGASIMSAPPVPSKRSASEVAASSRRATSYSTVVEPSR